MKALSNILRFLLILVVLCLFFCNTIDIIEQCHSCKDSINTLETQDAPLSISHHYVSSGFMGDGADSIKKSIKMKNAVEKSTDQYDAGPFHQEFHYIPSGDSGWGGVYWLPPDTTTEWEKKEGISIRGAKSVSFLVKGQNGNEHICFTAAGIAGHPLPDSTYQECIGIRQLSDSWQRFTIPLRFDSLPNVIGAFCWTARQKGNMENVHFCIDDIKFSTDPAEYSHDTLHVPIDVQTFFEPSDWMGDGETPGLVEINEHFKLEIRPDDTDSVITALRYTIGSKHSTSVAWVSIKDNRGRFPGKTIISAEKVTFWVKCAHGKEYIQFKSGNPAYKESFYASAGYVDVDTTWRKKSIDLSEADLSNVNTAFSWTIDSDSTGKEINFYIDKIVFE